MKHAFFAICIALAMAGCMQKPTAMDQSTVFDMIQTRVSVRQFTTQKPTEQQIDTLLRCAMAAPSALNRQPWAFLVIDDHSLLDALAFQFPNSRVGNGCGICIVPCGDLSKALEGEAQDFWINDVSAATENLLLAAHAMGLGAVWTGLHPDKQRVRMAQELLQLPEHIVPLCIVPVGYPAETPAVKDKYNRENIHYNRW